MADALLKIVHLTKRYGQAEALDRLSLEVRAGDLYGLIGPNGAGKTTTFKIVSTILQATSGTVLINGWDTRDKKRVTDIRRLIGYMPDSFGLYEDMTVEEYLTFFAAAYDIENPRRRKLVNDVLDLVDLAGKRDAVIETLSRGVQQRLGIARVLIHDPKLLILDEPASGLDPRARIEIRGLLQELRKMGKTILISSHILSDLREICTHIGILERGRLVREGPITDVLRQTSMTIRIQVNDTARAQALLQAESFVRAVREEQGLLLVELKEGFDATWQVSELLVRRGLQLLRFEPATGDLERAFVESTEGSVT